MATPDITGGEVLETAYYHSSNNLRPQVCVRHWRIDRVSGTDDLPSVDFADTMSAEWSDRVKTAMPTSHAYVSCVTRMVIPSDAGTEISLVGAGAGSSAGHPLAPNISACLVLRAEAAPPRRFGRVYLPSSTESFNQSQGVPTAGYVVAVTSLRNFLTNAFDIFFGDAHFQAIPVLWSRLDADVYDVTGFTLRRQWKNQRRRGGFWAPMPPP